jgi:hypothetical protein
MRFRRTSMPKLTPALDQPVLEENASTSGADAPPPPPTILFPRHTGPITALIVAVIVAYVSSFGAGWAGESLQTVRDNPQLSRATGAPLSGIVAPAETALSRDWARVVPRFTYWSNHNAASTSQTSSCTWWRVCSSTR